MIPARGGSKRLPRKNIRDFAGRPMIAHSIAVAQTSGLFDAVVVSTEDTEIAEVAWTSGADEVIERPAALAGDYTGLVPVVAHAAASLNELDEVCCILATAPFLTTEALERGLEALRTHPDRVAVSVTTFPFPIQRAVRRLPRGWLEPFYADAMQARSQDLEEAFHDAAQFYWARAGTFRQIDDIWPRAVGVEIPRHRVQDIDTEEDWKRAELMYAAWRSS